ncbi:MAG: AIR synthase related protein [Patescibacteria group bacterium]
MDDTKGVDYSLLDPFKIAAQTSARETSHHLKRFGYTEVEESRGESAYLIETPWGYLAHVEEGLGTKNIVADKYFEDQPNYECVGQDTVAMIVNDMVTLGAQPISLQMHVAAGASEWFSNKARADSLIRGWKRGCDLARCAWGGGETPALKDIVMPGTVVLSGSAMGVIRDKSYRIQERIEPGDSIILLESTGIHANGLTDARNLADSLTTAAHNGYHTRLPDGRTYGEHLLQPTPIYSRFIEACEYAKVDIHYAVNITGHGWRKLMRPRRPFAYVIEKLPPQKQIFDFLQKGLSMSDKVAYAKFNMGAGFAIYVSGEDTDKVLDLLNHYNVGGDHIRGFVAGHIEAAETARVEIRPKGIVYGAETLQIR